jgi:uncharacterized protein YigA (DUF484 family)
MIAIGSEDPERFYAGMGTIYLERLGEMARRRWRASCAER